MLPEVKVMVYPPPPKKLVKVILPEVTAMSLLPSGAPISKPEW